MKRLTYLSVVVISLFSFSACHKNSSSPSLQSQIAGKWNLQKQAYVQYVNDVKQVDTVCTAADTLTAYVQFNADKSYKSEGIFFSTYPNHSFSEETSVTGIYTVSNSTLTVSNTMAGLMIFEAAYGTTASNLPVTTITNQLHTSKLTAITSNTL